MRLIVGVDEVGRGPLAGPVSIGIVVCKKLLMMPELTDSKKMTEDARERVYELAVDRKKEGEIDFGVFSASASVIDEIGIEDALRRIIAQGLRTLVPEAEKADVILDGRLSAPKEYRQQTLIGGDLLVPAISLASVVAKVERDHYMVRIAEKYPAYGFEEHKGYGTARHIMAIQEKGPSAIHRMSFLKNITGATMPA
ncbi:hypothetical protein A2841_01155 [Candidatus Kaiserbacteria bacterium RIFCSPHIGHO2_01_FULL_48_10]|uniref:Ribonuclease n=1 Tax=Candidatus Kaiserbacteria bacterium RIFCSPHIGHO2_01_FULL_48_10 TaxID=1798476 RepID=A0A1F6C5X1_9BACT|nr:MAG: hypothetical protein A2841_01155 [Candidatus Kaiserbacteria bacterium RIFCSPHIGHO2_01_FULL_48_10]